MHARTHGLLQIHVAGKPADVSRKAANHYKFRLVALTYNACNNANLIIYENITCHGENIIKMKIKRNFLIFFSLKLHEAVIILFQKRTC